MIDSNKKLFKWGPIEFKMLYSSCFMEVVLTKITKYYPWAWPQYAAIYKKGRMLWINEERELLDVGSKYFKKYLINKNNYNNHWKKYKNWISKYDKLDKLLNKIDLNKLEDEELYSRIKEFYMLNIEFWLIVFVPEIANWGGEHLLKNKLTEIDKKKSDNYLEILSAPVKYSFFQREELDLLKIAIIKNKKDRNRAIKVHTQKYYWLLNSYGGNRILTTKYFAKKLNGLIKNSDAEINQKEIHNSLKHNKSRKKELIKDLKLNEDIQLIARQLSQSIWWQDHRKAYIWKMNYHWDKILKALSNRTKWKFEELQWFWAYELLTLLKNPERFSKRNILKRSNYYLLYGQNDKLKKTTDIKLINKYIKTFWPEDKINIKNIKGLVVSKGKGEIIKGTAKIIRDPFKDINKMKPGDILVASMTSPEYIVAMRKASAIITDVGGMTCHAAIVSRELGIPCIVDTKIAIRALKDGDEVEVDADKGVVKKI